MCERFHTKMGPVLETERLRLRPCRAEDVEPVHALWTDAGVRRFLFDDRVISPADTRSHIEGSLASFERRGYGLWLAFARGADDLIGFAGLLASGGESPNLIYGVRPEFWGRGYATEAAGGVLSYALDTLALAKVKADVDEPNAASVRVLVKLGMTLVSSGVTGGRPLYYFERTGRGDAV